jgi:hypothetical protein
VVLNGVGRVLESMSESANENDMGANLSIALLGLLLVVATFGMLVWAGKVARRRRWETLKWQDFEQFRKDEMQWHTAGIIGWVLTVIVFLGSLFMGLAEA